MKFADGRARVVRHGFGPARTIATGIGPVKVAWGEDPGPRDRGAAGDGEIRFSSAILPLWAGDDPGAWMGYCRCCARHLDGRFQEAANDPAGQGGGSSPPLVAVRRRHRGCIHLWQRKTRRATYQAVGQVGTCCM